MCSHSADTFHPVVQGQGDLWPLHSFSHAKQMGLYYKTQLFLGQILFDSAPGGVMFLIPQALIPKSVQEW